MQGLLTIACGPVYEFVAVVLFKISCFVGSDFAFACGAGVGSVFCDYDCVAWVGPVGGGGCGDVGERLDLGVVSLVVGG